MLAHKSALPTNLRAPGTSKVAAAHRIGTSRKPAQRVCASAEPTSTVPDTAKITHHQVKHLCNDKGYEFWDIRTPDEHAEGAKRWWKNVPFAFMSQQGQPVLNRQFKPFLLRSLPNKMSRVIFACDDGTDRSEMAYEMAAEEGYTAIKILEGGCLEYLTHDPLDSKDRAPRWKLTGQTSGVRYAYNDANGDGSFDDSA